MMEKLEEKEFIESWKDKMKNLVNYKLIVKKIEIKIKFFALCNQILGRRRESGERRNFIKKQELAKLS